MPYRPSATSILLDEYLEDSKDLIDEIEQIILTIEKEGGGEDLVAQQHKVVHPHLWECLMRTLHSFKGSAQLMGLDSVVSVAHALESLVSFFRNSSASPDNGTNLRPTVAPLCFECIDLLRSLAKELRVSGTCTKDISPVLRKIDELVV
jgi:chemotaxis protein histidine kinase CheA